MVVGFWRQRRLVQSPVRQCNLSCDKFGKPLNLTKLIFLGLDNREIDFLMSGWKMSCWWPGGRWRKLVGREAELAACRDPDLPLCSNPDSYPHHSSINCTIVHGLNLKNWR